MGDFADSLDDRKGSKETRRQLLREASFDACLAIWSKAKVHKIPKSSREVRLDWP
ncbi:hypothetical protein Syun_019459 [Stephania yunnanensis]|uniref:Uncharacterized protein n=1 Tax=Stephania yunnanensis TaxID=152371 RepID=A0AAP0IU48_9MAGN